MTRRSDDTLRHYLLGTLPEEQAEALEDDYFASRETLERVRAAEDDLLDDYVAERLTPAERERFEQRFGQTERQRERLLAARALRLAGAPMPARPAASPRPARAVQFRRRALLRLAALLLFACGAAWLWRALQPAPVDPPRQVEVPARPASPSPAAPPARVEPMERAPLVLALAPLAPRGEAGAAPLRIPAHARTVRLELEGEWESLQAAGSAPLAVELATVEGRRVWTGRVRRSIDGRRGVLATLELPAQRLSPGDYVVSVARDDGTTLERYFLRIRH